MSTAGSSASARDRMVIGVGLAVIVTLLALSVLSARRATSDASEVVREVQRSTASLGPAERQALIGETKIWGYSPDSPNPLAALAGGRQPVDMVSNERAVSAAYETHWGLSSRCVWVRLSATDVRTDVGSPDRCRARTL